MTMACICKDVAIAGDDDGIDAYMNYRASYCVTVWRGYSSKCMVMRSACTWAWLYQWRADATDCSAHLAQRWCRA